MLRRVIVVLLLMSLAIPAWCEAKKINTKDFQNQTGIKVIHHVDILFPGYANVGRVTDVDKFKAQGFEKVKKGDYVTFSTLDDGRVKVLLDSTGESKLIEIIEGR